MRTPSPHKGCLSGTLICTPPTSEGSLSRLTASGMTAILGSALMSFYQIREEGLHPLKWKEMHNYLERFIYNMYRYVCYLQLFTIMVFIYIGFEMIFQRKTTVYCTLIKTAVPPADRPPSFFHWTQKVQKPVYKLGFDHHLIGLRQIRSDRLLHIRCSTSSVYV